MERDGFIRHKPAFDQPQRAPAFDPPVEEKKLDTSSEAYRHECEIRYLRKLPVNDRVRFLAGLRGKRGDAAVDLIMKDLGAACLEEIVKEIQREAADRGARAILR